MPMMPRPRKQAGDAEGPSMRRWGLYTLGFLALAFVMVAVSGSQGHYTPLTLIGLFVGLGGAGYCTVKGLRKAKLFRL
jgi:nitrate/nitrite transporter NarK